jgi:hypothetical protein
MKMLSPLVRILMRTLGTQLLRRGIAWTACAVISLVLGGLLSRFLIHGRTFLLGLELTVVDLLPAFLFWPFSRRCLKDRLRSLDEETVFEAYLEAGPGPARNLLRKMAEEKAAALPFVSLPRETRIGGLSGLLTVALASLLLGEGVSFLLSGHALSLSPETAERVSRGDRLEESVYPTFSKEDPASRQRRREPISAEGIWKSRVGEDPDLGLREESVDPQAVSRGGLSPEQAKQAGTDTSAQDAAGERRQERRSGEDAADGSRASQAPREASRPSRKPAEPEVTSPTTFPNAAQNPTSTNLSPMPGQTGTGYEHTFDTRVPSPLVNYRSQFESRFEARTGNHIAATEKLGLGELRDYQRRIFDSFLLRADLDAGEDPYVALLKQRWMNAKKGAR